MSEITIKLQDLSTFVNIELSNDSETFMASRIKKLYAFLPEPIRVAINDDDVTISFKSPSISSKVESKSLSRKAAEFASKNMFVKAIELYKRSIELNPAAIESRRDISMVYSEMNKTSLAIDNLIEALLLNPRDSSSIVVLANLFLTKKGDAATAEKYLTKALDFNPSDPWCLNTLGFIMAKKGETEKAESLFNKSIVENPDFPNPYYGIAMLYIERMDYVNALDVLEQLFLNAKLQDSRSIPVFKQARSTYLMIQTKLAESRLSLSFLEMESFKEELKNKTNISIKVEEVDFKDGIGAKIQIAWRYGRDYHLIQTRKGYRQELLCHLETHELCHLQMEYEARQQGKNKYFSTDSTTINYAKRSVSHDIREIRNKGLSQRDIDGFLDLMISGLCGFLFNCPLDMLIEADIKQRFPNMAASQFVSIHILITEALKTLTDKTILSLVPVKVLNATYALNGAMAIFYDRLFEGTTDYSDFFKNHSTFPISKSLVNLVENKMTSLKSGEEFDLVDEFSEILGLNGWYKWVVDDGSKPKTIPKLDQSNEECLDDETDYSGSTNPELLIQKHPAAVMYFLDAFKTYDILDLKRIKQISLEIAVIGMSGLDYASPEQKYNLQSLPNKRLSGLQMMCFMYAGFKRFAPDEDTGMDLKDPYNEAMAFYNGGE